jgi:hypothetical protein
VKGDFGGITAANALCATAARNATPPLAGAFVAWLSDDVHDAAEAMPSATEWSLVGRDVVVGTRVAFTTGHLLAAIASDENGVATAGHVWTGTSAMGTRLATRTCSGWTSTSGNGAAGDDGVTEAAFTEVSPDDACGTDNHVYCYEK